ncbi:unnamed protein product [Rhizophagus irregularis]|nr:unnamed protein product [Rhizophagus irregularis]CAB4430928.1 unnamed protein product [Rhizophagus irregularis]CAB4443108.1 unnamed protein product [Rhizophagus irregularis]
MYNQIRLELRPRIPELDVLLVVDSVGMKFLAPQSSEICDKRSLDFRHFSWSGIYDFRHSLGVELRQIFGILLSGIYGSRFLAFS